MLSMPREGVHPNVYGRSKPEVGKAIYQGIQVEVAAGGLGSIAINFEGVEVWDENTRFVEYDPEDGIYHESSVLMTPCCICGKLSFFGFDLCSECEYSLGD